MSIAIARGEKNLLLVPTPSSYDAVELPASVVTTPAVVSSDIKANGYDNNSIVNRETE